MYGIDVFLTAMNTLIGGELYDITSCTSIHDSLEDLHTVRKQANRTVTCAVRKPALLIPNRHRCASVPFIRFIPPSNNLVEGIVSHSARL